MKREYSEGLMAREKFEKTMMALFRVPKNAVKKAEKLVPKKRAGKD